MTTSTTMSGVDASHIKTGDVLLFRGPDPLSEISRFVDVARYDHAALVVDAAPGGVAMVVDLGVRGSGHYILSDYETKPSEVCVRRHRIRGGEALIAARALQHRGDVTDYSFNRLVSIVLVCLTRFGENLATLEPAMARSFAFSVTSLFEMAADRRESERGESTIRSGVCVDTILWPHDTFGSDAPDAPYYGLTIDRPPAGGLLGWVASAVEFEEFLIAQTRSRRTRPTIDGATPMVHGLQSEIASLYRSFHFSSIDPIVPDDDELRASVVNAGQLLANELAIDTARLGRLGEREGSSLLSVMALWLLDSFLTDGVITTPRDLETTKSLYDVGLLDLDSIPWTRAKRT